MARALWDQGQDFNLLQERINRIFKELGNFYLPDGQEWERKNWTPVIDICETENGYLVRAEIPGVNKDDIKIELKDNTITLRGERKFMEDVPKHNYLRMEREYGTFIRSFILPHDVDPNNIKARYKDGILELTLPRKEEAKPKQIMIEVS